MHTINLLIYFSEAPRFDTLNPFICSVSELLLTVLKHFNFRSNIETNKLISSKII